MKSIIKKEVSDSSRLAIIKDKQERSRNPFEPGDFVRITDLNGFNYRTKEMFRANPFNQVMESNKWGIRIFGFEGFYHHHRFTINLELANSSPKPLLENKKKLIKSFPTRKFLK